MKNNKALTPRARDMRKNMTAEELRLWTHFFKLLPLTVRRQKVFGNYIVDFYIASRKLVVEVDGSQHYTAEGKAYDQVRDDYLRACGCTVLRYSNADVKERFEEVCADILKYL